MSELLFRENAYLKSCEATVIAVHGDAVELDRTVFYPLGGGQAGDSGRIGAWRVLDTRKGPLPDQVLHVLEPGTSASVGRINDDKAHLDFDIEMERLVKDAIEAQVNELVRSATATRAQWITDAELDARPELVKTMSVAPPRGEGRVRLLEIPGIDLQACGGTHVANTGEIGALKVVRIRSEGKRNKRVTVELA